MSEAGVTWFRRVDLEWVEACLRCAPVGYCLCCNITEVSSSRRDKGPAVTVQSRSVLTGLDSPGLGVGSPGSRAESVASVAGVL